MVQRTEPTNVWPADRWNAAIANLVARDINGLTAKYGYQAVADAAVRDLLYHMAPAGTA